MMLAIKIRKPTLPGMANTDASDSNNNAHMAADNRLSISGKENKPEIDKSRIVY